MQNFLIYLGTSRTGNYSQYAAELIKQVIDDRADCTAELIDPRKLDLQFDHEADGNNYPELQKKVQAADGYILVSPEYNHGYPASLKFMLDLFLKEYIHKPVTLVGVSAGLYGGTRVIELLAGVVRELGMVATFSDINFSNIQKEVENGQFTNRETWERRINKAIDELIWMSQALKYGRENLPQDE